MGKKKNRNKTRKKRKRNPQTATPNPERHSGHSMDEGGVHSFLSGRKPPPEFEELLTENFQSPKPSGRNSPLWDEMVREFGEQDAEKLLKQCQPKLIPSG